MLPARPRVSVNLRPGVITPGSAFDALVRLDSRRVIPVKRVDCRLRGEVLVMQANGMFATQRIVELAASATPKTLPAGPSELRVRFAIPPSAPPSYRGTTIRAAYTLTVYVDIPWWIDRESTFVIPVSAPPASVTDRGAKSFARVQDSGLRVECALDRTVVAPGGVLAGRLAFFGVEAAGLRAVRVRLRCLERWGAGTIDGPNYLVEIPIERQVDGDAHTFRMRIPEDAVPAFDTPTGCMWWQLDVEGDTKGRATATLLDVPIQVVAPETSGLDFFSELPLIGDQRRAEMLARIARRTGLRHEVETDRLVGQFGGVSLSIERVAATGHNRVELRWRPLGIALSVGPARWNDAISRYEITVGLPMFDEAYQVRGREARQVLAVVTPFAHADGLLHSLRNCAIRDDGASLVAPSQPDEESLMRLAYSAASLAERVRIGIEGMPPPQHFAEHADAWRSLAGRFRGQFRQGDCAMHRLELFNERLDVEHVWDDARVRETIVRAHFDPPLEAPPDRSRPESVRADWREALDALDAQGGRWSVTKTALEVRVAAVRDAVDAERWIDVVASTARTLQGRRNTGPFR
ncbi:MAG: hypothetical protein JNK05_22310 [Myxococcales bacterium]|nr:hypothetical protein [Myxococcales bacterium]